MSHTSFFYIYILLQYLVELRGMLVDGGPGSLIRDWNHKTCVPKLKFHLCVREDYLT